jgi:hypothetical protein
VEPCAGCFGTLIWDVVLLAWLLSSPLLCCPSTSAAVLAASVELAVVELAEVELAEVELPSGQDPCWCVDVSVVLLADWVPAAVPG